MHTFIVQTQTEYADKVETYKREMDINATENNSLMQQFGCWWQIYT